MGTSPRLRPELRKRYDAIEVELRVDAEGDFAEKTFVGHHAHRPNVYLFVVLGLLYDFWRVVKRRA